VKRDWQAVLIEVKKLRPARVQTFANVEVDVDADGETLVIEFPSDQEFSMQLAEDGENRDLLKRALAGVFGAPPPFRFQLGRGAVRPPTHAEPSPPPPPTHVDVAPDEEPPVPEPAAEHFEAASGLTEPTTEGHLSTNASELERLLHGMGATIVGERTHDPEGEDD
jgi:hypothetical protein